MRTGFARMCVETPEAWAKGAFYGTRPEGGGVALEKGTRRGVYMASPVDGGGEGFEWGRVKVKCDIPADTGLFVSFAAADVLYDMKTDKERVERLLGERGVPRPTKGDFYASVTGRYLYLAFELVSAGVNTPRISALSVQMGGDHMGDYLPAIYEGDFTKRFLSVFESFFTDMEQSIYDIPRSLDYECAGPRMLAYLAAWLCLNPEGVSESELRSRFKTALFDYSRMFTVEGIKQSIERILGAEPIIVENFNVSPNREGCACPGLYERLYGDEPYKFYALIDEAAFSGVSIEGFLTKMSGLLPADREMELVLLKKRVMLDAHTYLGINACISGYAPARLEQGASIQLGGIIGGKAN